MIKQKPGFANQFIFFLSLLRTQKIELESKKHYECSQQETICFGYLQEFFKNMKECYELLSSQSFKEKCIKICESNYFDKNEMTLHGLDNTNWQTLNNMAKLLLEKQMNETIVDWSGFFEQFKSAYASSMQREWAQFYNKLHDDIALIQKKLKKADGGIK